MNDQSATVDLSSEIGTHLPYLRRYARALTGGQTSGDRYAAATLEAILEDPSVFEPGMPTKVALFRAFHLIWASTGTPVAQSDETLSRLEAAAIDHLSALTPNTREALLLHTIEGFEVPQIGQIISVPESEAESLINIALQEMEASITGKVMIIEDEAIIAMDLHSIVSEMGHDVVGIARTKDAAVEMGSRTEPDLVLADIQLADNSSGIDAVNELYQQFGDMPVIFITAFPERLLTGERPEPAFLISKPYSEEQVRSAVSQAMFFSSTETLNKAS
ncbi:response regulator [Anianabacter salinae]|uniref:response regulator n=1 Tax=Anianabacter salinae TaxID=2851023 RepID=UPI00225E182E|nr:response regulator [Anianabacter salinae]MBV0913684.1 response regulator [Anianabacter salinae]